MYDVARCFDRAGLNSWVSYQNIYSRFPSPSHRYFCEAWKKGKKSQIKNIYIYILFRISVLQTTSTFFANIFTQRQSDNITIAEPDCKARVTARRGEEGKRRIKKSRHRQNGSFN